MRSLTKVGHHYKLVPSAISKRMASLEKELGGTPLFKRVRQGLEPTSAGLGFLKYAQEVLQTIERGSRELRGYSDGRSGLIRMMSSISALSSGLMQDIHHFLLEPVNQAINLELHHSDGSDLTRLLREEMFHLVILWNVEDTVGLVTYPYRSDELCVVVPSKHALATRPSLDIKESLAFDFVGLHSAARAESILRRAKALENTEFPRYRLKVPTNDHAFRAVHSGLGICLAPANAQQHTEAAKGLVFIPLTNDWAKRHFVICHKDTETTPAAAKRLASFLSEAAIRNDMRWTAEKPPAVSP